MPDPTPQTVDAITNARGEATFTLPPGPPLAGQLLEVTVSHNGRHLARQLFAWDYTLNTWWYA